MGLIIILGVIMLGAGCVLFVMKSMQPKATVVKNPATNTTTTQVRVPNGVAALIRLFGMIILIGGILVGCFSLDTDITPALTAWFTYTFYATMLYGFAEIIQLLQDIKNK